MLPFAFFLAILALFFQSVPLSGLPIHAFVPWITLVTLNDPRKKRSWNAPWLSAAAGCLVDLLSEHPLGLHPITYSLTSLFLLRFRNRFFRDRPLHLALFSVLASFLSSFLQIF